MGFWMTLLLTILIAVGLTEAPITLLWISYALSFFF
jgi:hypothetical protein